MPTEGPGSESGNYAVTRLTVTDFRNHAAGQIDVPGGECVVLAGPNGAGKTNLLEALSFLAPGRGLRRASLDKIGRVGAPAGRPWAISARIRTPDGERQVGTGLDPAGAPESLRRIVRVDGQPLPTQAELGKILALSWLTPQMDRLFIDGASQRRRFFDRLVHGFVPGH
ncbi:MAG: AAA family ATPase, partial [Pseudomonadota bacterium]